MLDHRKVGGMSNMGFHRSVPTVTVVALAVLILIGLPSKGNAQFALYDNFAGGFIDPNLWQSISTEGSSSAPTAEARRTIEEGALRMSLTSWGNDTSDTGSALSRERLQIKQLGTLGGSGFINGLKAKVTVLNAEAQDCVSNVGSSAVARAVLVAFFFNDGSSGGAGDATGDIGVALTMNTSAAGNQIQASVSRCTNSGCSGFANVAIPNNP